ncbi:MAG: Universal stress protein [Candidatus Argoarchaeum ethanivorans]|uniref:Universal stress protein n=1 Tax=Candidatus Argoarchaeum ethanivorans TaxID=2608793 RepID=A0A811T8Q9_9EURY|nr:MAG: Universal stress protein [Candidatus Argoarchaeum ethanivorans]
MVSEIYKKIVVATDGSKEAEKAIESAVELARLAGAKLYALYVVDRAAFLATPLVTMPIDVAWGELEEHFRHEGAEATKKIADAAAAVGVEFEAKVVEGHAAEEIIKFSEELPADLVVMGSLGKSGLSRFLLGSVADKVTRNAKLPVMVVRS